MDPQLAYRAEVVNTPEIPGARVVRLGGVVDHSAASGLRRTLLEQVGRRPPEDIVVELSGVAALDTSGAAVLVEALREADGRGLRLLLCAPSPSVLAMFRLAGFEEVLGSCCSCADDARSRLARSAGH